MPLSSTLSTLPQAASAHADTARLCPSNLYLLLPFLPDSFLLLNPQKEWDPPGLEPCAEWSLHRQFWLRELESLPGTRAQLHAQTAARALCQGCRATSLLPGLPPAPVPGRNSLSPVRRGQDALSSDFEGSQAL